MSWPLLEKAIHSCRKCPRLIAHSTHIARVKTPRYRDETYWGRPVTGFGDKKARVWIVGLAPGAHGANRTGRMFTGDSSGEWLYGALYRHGFSSLPASKHRTDALKLNDVYISSAGRCAPPDNKPTPEELHRCSPYLDREFSFLKNIEGFLVLGQIAFRATAALLKRHGIALEGKFAHGALLNAGRYWVLSSYHPSQQNTRTKRLTLPMWDAVFETTRGLLGHA